MPTSHLFDRQAWQKIKTFQSIIARASSAALGSSADEIPLNAHNLSLFDQEFALQWVRRKIAALGGAPNRISFMAQSAGATHVTFFLQMHPIHRPFRSVITF